MMLSLHIWTDLFEDISDSLKRFTSEKNHNSMAIIPKNYSEILLNTAVVNIYKCQKFS